MQKANPLKGEQNIEIRPEKLWQRVLILVLTIALALCAGLILIPVAAWLGIDLKELQGTNFKITTINLIITFCHTMSQFMIIYFINRIFHKRSYKDFGFRQPIFKLMGIGILIGLFWQGTNLAIHILMSDKTSIVWAVEIGTPVFSVIFHVFFMLIFMLTINSLKEEIVFRTYPIELFIYKPKALLIIIVLVSLYFSGIHNIIEPISITAFINGFIIALFYCFVYFYWRSIWFISGIHTGMNIIPFLFCGKWEIGGLWALSYSGQPGIIAILIHALLFCVIICIMYRFRPSLKIR